jgi:DNA repair exonuclease SbcCD ATPase subunit
MSGSKESGSAQQAAKAQRILSTPGPGDSPGDQSSGAEGETPQQKQQRESRYARTRRLKQELKAREEALAQREAQLQQAERAKKAPKKPDYTIEELKEYRENWEADGKFELVEQADKEIARLEALQKQENQTQGFVNEWRQAEADLAQADPEFMRKGTRLDTKLREIMAGPDGKIYTQHPRGIVAAYHRARMEILEGDYRTAQGKIRELEQELERVTGLTSIGGGAPSRPGSGGRVESLKDFSKLSSAEMRKRLTSTRSGSLPWL